jgi:glutathione synthase/RimK-type ligase-like ATP-grasp enzyme
MKIGILSKRKTHLTGNMKGYYESKGHEVTIFTADNLCINESLLKNDFYILKSKQIFYLYAGYYLEAHNVPVIPETDISFKIKNRIESQLLLRKANILTPDFYIGTLETLKIQLKNKNFPLIAKPIMGSGSRGVKFIKAHQDLDLINTDDYIYVEKFIEGTHYIIYFIGDDICSCEKTPLVNEHTDAKHIEITKDMRQIVYKFKNSYNLLFGHLDIVKEKNTGKIFVVDPGSFPEFSNWKCKVDTVPLLCNLILEEFNKKLMYLK